MQAVGGEAACHHTTTAYARHHPTTCVLAKQSRSQTACRTAGMLELATPSGVEFALEAVLIGGSMLLAGACIDRLGYGRYHLTS